MRNRSQMIALGGVLAALAVVIMTMGSLIPVATYVCPMLCGLILFTVFRLCGRRVAWAWYGAVALLSLLLSPDKEAAAVFLGLGYYPILKPFLDAAKFSWLWKLIIFNTVTVILYSVLMYVIGMSQLLMEFQELGLAGLILTMILGNISFLLFDRLLEHMPAILNKKRRSKK